MVLNSLGGAAEAELQARWARFWQVHSFAQALDEGDVDLAWSLLSDTAEGVLSGTDGRNPAGYTLRSQSWEPRRAHAGHRDMASPETVALRRLRRLLRRALHYQRHPSVDLLRHLRRGVRELQSEFGELKEAPDVTAAAFCDLLHNLVEHRANSEQQQCLHKWRDRMRGSEKEHRRWVKSRTQDFKEYCRHQTETIKPGVSFRSLHPARVLQQAEDEWTQVWTAGEVHPDRYRRLLQQVERPPALDFQAVFDGPTLLQLATQAAGKAGGPDSWLPDQLAQLPMEFWNGVASLWGLVFRTGRIPSRWLESRVCLIPKPSGDLRPLTVTSVLWRLGTRSLVQQLRPWLLTWLDHHTLGGVFGSGVLDAHLMLHADSEDATYIAQDLHRFFQSIGG